MSNIHACVQLVDYSNVTVQERGRRANFVNLERAKYHKVMVDKCLVSDEKIPKADWIISKLGVGSVIVELKGKDLAHACEQLFATLENPVCRPWLEERKALLIVCSRVPKFDTSVAKAEVRARKLGMRLATVCGQAEVSIEDLLSG